MNRNQARQEKNLRRSTTNTCLTCMRYQDIEERIHTDSSCDIRTYKECFDGHMVFTNETCDLHVKVKDKDYSI